MLLVVDVGNTNTVVGVLDGGAPGSTRAGELRAHWRLETRARRTADEYAATLHQLFQLANLPWKIDAGMIATVVPPALFACQQFFQQHLKIEPLVVGPGLKTGMPILYDNPKEVGADRIVNAVAAYERWKTGCIIVDFGTATTFDLVTPRGEYAGGAIATGISTSADALYQAAAKLPRVEFKRPESVIGKNTVASMQAGLFYGYVGLTDEIVTRMRAAVDYPCTVIATGGLATLIARDSKTIEHTDEMLTLTGLGIIWGAQPVMALELTPLETLPAPVERSAVAKAPPPLKMMAARGLAPLGPADLLTTLYQLSFADDEAVKTAAFKTATELPEKILNGALGDESLDARVLDFFARRVFQRPSLLERVLFNRSTSDETFHHLAKLVEDAGLETIAKNEERLLRHPAIIAALYLNPKTRMSTAQRALELAVRNNVRVDGIPAFDEAARAIQQSGNLDPETAAKEDAAFAQAAEVAVDQAAALQLIAVDENEALTLAEQEAALAEAAAESPDILDEVKKKKISELSPAGKIRLATLGNAFARAVLIRDTNRQVAMAAIRSPAVNDMEVLRYATNRGLDDEIVRFIANKRQWVRLYGVKVALVNNPKCPLPIAMRFLVHLNVRDLKNLARSKGVPSALCTAAKQMLTQRNA